jgi:rhodanese-related sulfurtransferase
MHQYTAFLATHWGLTLLFIAAFFWVIISESKSRATKGLTVTSAQATQLMNRENAKVLDIRKDNDFIDGHIVGSKNVSAETLKTNLKSLSIKPDQAVILVCYRGQSTLPLVTHMRKQGYVKTVALAGGVQGWQQAELPLVK